MKKQLIILTLIISSFGINLFAETLTRKTITEALNYDGNRENIKHLIITDSIAGSDYLSAGSEWREFRNLNLTFPNLEEITIYTDQDIPDGGWDYENDVSIPYLFGDSIGDNAEGALWLKSFSAPNVKYIGESAFYKCGNLSQVYFPNAETIGGGAFAVCNSLTSIEAENFPKVRILREGAFIYCNSLTSVNFPSVTTLGSYMSFGGDPEFMGMVFWRCEALTEVIFPSLTTIARSSFFLCTNLTTVYMPLVTTIHSSSFSNCWALPEINFPLLTTIEGHSVFAACFALTSVSIGTDLEEGTETDYANTIFQGVPTYWADLTLGEYVAPKPNLTNLTWLYSIVFPNDRVDYYWRSITIKKVGIEEIIKDISVEVYPNPTTEYTTLSFSLEKPCYLAIDLYDINGKKVKELYNNFATAELFTTRINTENLAKGTYFIKISIDKDFVIKKIIVN